MRYEFTGAFGYQISFSFSNLLIMYIFFSIIVVAIELYKRRQSKNNFII
jgi:hypothetical protein